MEWIKITPGTELPKDAPILLYDSDMKAYDYGFYEGRETIFIPNEGYGNVSEYTHYCIITPPLTQQDIKEQAERFIAEWFVPVVYVTCPECDARNCPNNPTCINCDCKLQRCTEQ